MKTEEGTANVGTYNDKLVVDDMRKLWYHGSGELKEDEPDEERSKTAPGIGQLGDKRGIIGLEAGTKSPAVGKSTNKRGRRCEDPEQGGNLKATGKDNRRTWQEGRRTRGSLSPKTRRRPQTKRRREEE